MTPDRSPAAQRAQAVLRAAEAAAAAAASRAPSTRGDEGIDRARIVELVDELDARVRQARARVDELEAAVERLLDRQHEPPH